MASPYLPYLVKNVSDKVNTFFSTRTSDPFNVFFDHGLYVDVDKNIYSKDNGNTFPLIWLVTTSIDIQRGQNVGMYGTATFDVIIAMPTSNEYTQRERDELVFIPRLIPIYDRFIYELSQSSSFRVVSESSIKDRYKYRPYWGGGEGGADTKNLFKNFIDAIQVIGIQLEMKKVSSICTPSLFKALN